jgi:hypothetical protein
MTWQKFNLANLRDARGLRARALLQRREVAIGVGERIARVVEKYGVTHVVISFGAAEGGAVFADWLRERINERKGYRERTNVYVDATALQDLPGSELVMSGTRYANGVATGGRLSSANDGWAEYYKHAISMANVMVFSFTASWFRSAWCGRELNYYIQENGRRLSEGRPALIGLGLLFEDEVTGVPPVGGVRLFRTRKKYLLDARQRARLQSTFHDNFVIDDDTLNQLLAAIP